MDAYLKQTKLIPRNHLQEIRFEDLEQAQVCTLRGIYEALDLPNCDATEEKVHDHLDSIADFQKNSHDTLPVTLQKQIVRECHRCFEEWGYPKNIPPDELHSTDPSFCASFSDCGRDHRGGI
jgi:hypothetical protein